MSSYNNLETHIVFREIRIWWKRKIMTLGRVFFVHKWFSFRHELRESRLRRNIGAKRNFTTKPNKNWFENISSFQEILNLYVIIKLINSGMNFPNGVQLNNKALTKRLPSLTWSSGTLISPWAFMIRDECNYSKVQCTAPIRNQLGP